MKASLRLLLVLTVSSSVVAAPEPDAAGPVGAGASHGLVQVNTEQKPGSLLITFPPPGADGISMRVLYVTSLRTGLGAAPSFLDRGRLSESQVLAFRRIGSKLVIAFENPRFRTAESGGSPSSDFGTSVVWMGEIASTGPDGRFVADIAKFLTTDTLGIARSLNRESDAPAGGPSSLGAGRNFRMDDALSTTDPASVKVFPDNLEVDAVQTYAADKPGDEVGGVVPYAQRVTFTVHHSFIRLPGPGFLPRVFDPRIGGVSTQVVDFGEPLGGDVVKDYANRFRLEKLDPSAARSPVKKPIIFYVDRNAPEPIRSALIEGANWWGKAFDAAGYVDAYRVELLPEGIDPMDVRYNVIQWVDRATRGWSYGQEVVDPRTGEIVKGMVVLGSLRVRQDIEIFKGLMGVRGLGQGGPNDPIQVAIARLHQLAAHEVGHSLGFAHNFAASTQNRASVMDYPAPRINLVDGKPDLSDAYGVGVGQWDMATVDWLYGEPPAGEDSQSAANAKAAATVAAGLRYVRDDNARRVDTAQPWGALWDDGPDPVAELARLMTVRRAAIDRFDLNMLGPGEPVANLRRRFVPIWLLHRYQVVAAAKLIGGVDFAYAVRGDGRETSPPVGPGLQRAALAGLLVTLSPQALRVPARLTPLLSSPRNGSDNRQFDIELLAAAGGPVFDPLVAGDVAAEVTLGALLAPTRLERLELQHAMNPEALGVEELVDRLLEATLPNRTDALTRRIAYRTIVSLAQAAHQKQTTPEVAAILDDRVLRSALALTKRHSDAADSAWSTSLARQLLDPKELTALLADRPRSIDLPPGEPIGAESEWMDLP